MEKIKKILNELHPEYDFGGSANFIEDGYLDSFDMVALVSGLDEAFEISIDGLDIIPENFCSYESILATVKKNGGKV